LIEGDNLKDNPKDRILKSAMGLLLKKDITRISTREVVKDAGVNISQLHYYFKTKNELFSKAIVLSTENYFREWVSKNINLKEPSIYDLERYVGSILETIYIYPTISKSKIYMVLQDLDISSLSFGFIDDLFQIVSKLSPELPGQLIRQKIHILGQLIISLRVTTSLIGEQTELDFNNKTDRYKYNILLLNQIFPELY